MRRTPDAGRPHDGSSWRSCPNGCPRSARPWSRSARPTPPSSPATATTSSSSSTTSSRRWPTRSRRARRRARETSGGVADEGVHSAPLGAIARRDCSLRSGGVGPVDRRGPRRDGALPGSLRGQAADGPRARRHGRRRLSRRHARDHRLAQAGRHHRAEPDHPVDGRGPRRHVEGPAPTCRRSSCAAFELTGGADRIRLELGAPTGVVPVRLSGRRERRCASNARATRPCGCASRAVRVASSSTSSACWVGIRRHARVARREPRRGALRGRGEWRHEPGDGRAPADLTASEAGGEGGIRTLGAGYPTQRFSKPSH